MYKHISKEAHWSHHQGNLNHEENPINREELVNWNEWLVGLVCRNKRIKPAVLKTNNRHTRLFLEKIIHKTRLFFKRTFQTLMKIDKIDKNNDNCKIVLSGQMYSRCYFTHWFVSGAGTGAFP